MGVDNERIPIPAFPSLTSVQAQFFSQDAQFIRVFIRPPNAVVQRDTSKGLPPQPPGLAATDPWMPLQIQALQGFLQQVLGPRAQIHLTTYPALSQEDTQRDPITPYIVFEYVPQHAVVDPNTGFCFMNRAIRIHNSGQISGPFIWPWILPPPNPPGVRGAGKRKQAPLGVCPSDIQALLAAQAPDGTGREIFDSAAVAAAGGEGGSGKSGSSTVLSQSSTAVTSPPGASSSGEVPAVPAGPTASQVFCSSWALGPGGTAVGTGCDGPHGTVTVASLPPLPT